MSKTDMQIECMRKELRTLADISKMQVSPSTKKATHDRMIIVAFQLQEALA